MSLTLGMSSALPSKVNSSEDTSYNDCNDDEEKEIEIKPPDLKTNRTRESTDIDLTRGENMKPTVIDILTSVRMGMVTLVFSAQLIMNAPRFIMPIALVCMINPVKYNATTTSVVSSINSSSTLSTEDSTFYEFDWDAGIESLILQAPYYTLWISPMLGEFTRAKWDSKISVLFWTSMSIVLTAAIPVAARTSPYLVVVLFALQGLTWVILFSS